MRWNIHTKVEELISEPSSFHPVTEALLTDRGYREVETRNAFLHPDYEEGTHDPFLFSAMEQVVERVQRAKDEHEVVGIFGDFDADGVTSSVLLRQALEELGITTSIYLPDKLTEGHGLNLKALDFFASEKASLIFTLDCGMMNHEEVVAAKERDIETIIIDHHHVPEVLPAAFAIVNPKLKNEQYPFRELCGAGTTFKVIQALFMRLAPEKEEQLKWLLDIVAIGTVADVMPLVGENRVFVKYGLLVLSKTRNLGLQALLEVAKISCAPSNLSAELIAFQIAPRINAASRMAHAKIAHDLLMARTRAEALSFAQELQKLNSERQKQSQAVTKEVINYLEKEKKDRHFLLAAAPHYPYGIIGLIAGRIANTHQKPTAILTRGETISRGSFRGVPGFSLIKALEECAPLLHRYGGHEQAAGMQIPNENLVAFEEKFNALVAAWKEEQKISSEVTLHIDAEILPSHITPELIRDLKKLAPFGEGNREPVFTLQKGTLQDVRVLGKNNEHLKLGLEIGGRSFDGIGFQLGEKAGHLTAGALVDLAFTLEESVWQGRTRLQLKILDLRLA